ncbi:MAG: hypothetical protein L6Q98_09200 [Anaerolineae bacterium]|nr:hypothetical protein [Anaerolineae bacterium]NUQ06041.1 hypothetical protein [Anaerolineae bacterium]
MSGEILIVLRIAHIIAGTLWVGAAVSYFFFVEPTVKLLGGGGPKFMQGFMEKRRYPLYMNISSAITIVAGALLYWNTSGNLQSVWIQTRPGLGFTVGSIIAILGYLIGFFMIRPRAQRLAKLGQTIGMAGGPPTPEQSAEMQMIDQQMKTVERVEVILLVIALLLMATARYW